MVELLAMPETPETPETMGQEVTGVPLVTPVRKAILVTPATMAPVATAALAVTRATPAELAMRVTLVTVAVAAEAVAAVHLRRLRVTPEIRVIRLPDRGELGVPGGVLPTASTLYPLMRAQQVPLGQMVTQAVQALLVMGETLVVRATPEPRGQQETPGMPGHLVMAVTQATPEQVGHLAM